MQSTQFRLRGPGNKESLARDLLIKLPVSKPTHIVKAGLKGRLVYTFKRLIPKFDFSKMQGTLL
jgi:dimethylaniline monooxygenase (N-oxide forming)